MAAVKRLLACAVACGVMLVATTSAHAGSGQSDPGGAPAQWWHSTKIGWWSGGGTTGRPLVYSPAWACLGGEPNGEIGVDYEGSAFANQTSPNTAHVMGELRLTFRVATANGLRTYEGHSSVSFNDVVTATLFPDQAYVEKVLPVDLVPMNGGQAVSTLWPVQLWAGWSSSWTVAIPGFGIETCASS